MDTTGRARVETDILDTSTLSPTGLKGISAVLGITERGPIGESILVGSWIEYRRHFGGYIAGSKFASLCKRTLDRGGKLRIGRVAHFDDVTDLESIDGSVSTGVVTRPVVPQGGGAAVATPTGVEFDASNIGAWGNDLTVVIANAASGIADTFDITVSLAGYDDLGKTVYGYNKTITQLDIDRFNTEMLLVKMVASSLTNILAVGSFAFSGGSQDISEIDSSDYIGDASTSTGIHVFDAKSDFVKVSVPELAIPELDAALVAYAESRKDCRAVLRTPIGITGLTAVDYRYGTGVYTHAPINSWFASMIFGELKVYDAILKTNQNIPALSDVLGVMSMKDSKTKEWFSAAGSKRGLIGNIVGVAYNLGTTARATEFDQVVNAGINPVVNDDSFGPVYWGNRTLYRGNSLLQKENVADLLIYIVRTVNPLAKSELFDPNDPITWRNIFKKVNPILRSAKEQRAFWDYLYEGDQYIDDISEAIINSSTEVDNGAYTFYIWMKPKVGLEYIGIKVVVTNSGVNLSEASGQPNSII